MRHSFIPGLILFFIGLLFGLKSFAQSNRKTLETDKFHSIEITGAMKAEIQQGAAQKIEIEGDEKFINELKATVSNGILSFAFAKPSKATQDKTKIIITTDSLKAIKLTGASEGKISGTFQSDELAITLTGASNLKGDLQVNQLNLQVSGASDAELSGKSKNVIINASGASDVKAGKLEADKAEIEASGASDVSIQVKESIKGAVSGASDLNYTGEPKEIAITSSGASDVRKNGTPDTTKLRFGKSKVWIMNEEEKNFENMWFKNNLVWMGIDVGINGWATPGFKAQTEGDYAFMKLDYARSWMVRWNAWEAKFALNKAKTATILTGMGFEWNNFSFDNKIILRESNDFPGTFPTTLIDVKDSSQNVMRSRLQAAYFSIPLMLNFRTIKKPKKGQFNFTAGVIGSVRIAANPRHTTVDEGRNVVEIRKDDFNLAPWRATAMVRMRYSFVNLFGSYTFTPLFKSGGPLLYPWTVGVSFSL